MVWSYLCVLYSTSPVSTINTDRMTKLNCVCQWHVLSVNLQPRLLLYTCLNNVRLNERNDCDCGS